MTGQPTPTAPGRLGVAAQPGELLTYLADLDDWLADRRAQLAAVDEQLLGSERDELTGDLTLALALWQAARARQEQLLSVWDSGRAGPRQLDQLSALIWGRLDTNASDLAQVQSMAVSLPEAMRLGDALLAQLRHRLDRDPDQEQQLGRLRELRAQLDRIRDQANAEPEALRPAAATRLAGLTQRLTELTARQGRGGDIGGLLGSLEADAARAERDLIVTSAQRRDARQLLARARQQLADLTAAGEELAALAQQAAVEVWPVPPVDLAEVDRLARVPNTAAALGGYLAELAAAAARIAQARLRLTAALDERDTAVGRAAELQASAAAAGHDRHPALAELGNLLNSRLAARPVVLPVAHQLLAAYAAQLRQLEQP